MTPIVVGIAGGSGSGKTTLARRITGKLPPDTVLLFQHDAYYHDRAKMPDPDPANINYDHPDALETALCAGHLEQLRGGVSIEQPVYDFTTHQRTAETLTLESKPVILVEGILVLASQELERQMDIRIFVDAAQDIQLLRRMERDLGERGRSMQSVREQYFRTVRPMYERYVAPSRKQADVIVPRGGENQGACDLVAGYLLGRLK